MREAERQVEGRWRSLLTEVIEEGRSTGEFATDSAENAALALGAMIDGLAVQVTIEDPAVSRERMLAICVSERGDAAPRRPLRASRSEGRIMTGSRFGEAAKDAVRETVPHLADTELRRELE